MGWECCVGAVVPWDSSVDFHGACPSLVAAKVIGYHCLKMDMVKMYPVIPGAEQGCQ